MDSAISLIILLGVSTIIVSALIAILWTGMVMSGKLVNETAQMSAQYLSTSTISSRMFLSYEDVLSSYWPTTLTPDASGRYVRAFDLAELRVSHAPRYSAAAAYVFMQENSNVIATFYCPLCQKEYKGADMGICLFKHSGESPPVGTTDASNTGFLVFLSDPVTQKTGDLYVIPVGVVPDKLTVIDSLYAVWVR